MSSDIVVPTLASEDVRHDLGEYLFFPIRKAKYLPPSRRLSLSQVRQRKFLWRIKIETFQLNPLPSYVDGSLILLPLVRYRIIAVAN